MPKILHFPIRAKPYAHQINAANTALKHLLKGGGATLLMEMGTGKTLTSIGITGYLRQKGLIRRLLICAPLSILSVWRDEFEHFAAYDYSLVILEGTSSWKTDTMERNRGLLLWSLDFDPDSCKNSLGCLCDLDHRTVGWYLDDSLHGMDWNEGYCGHDLAGLV